MPLNWILINSEALSSLDLDHLIQDVEKFECATYAGAISRLAKNTEHWSEEQHECLRFVSAVLTMNLQANQTAEPFGPMFVMDGQRSAIPADFPKEALLGLQPWAMSLKDPELRARFLDVIWVQARSFPAALAAIEAYVESAQKLEHPENWTCCHKRLERALRLSASLGKGGTELRIRVLNEIESTLQRYRGTDPLYLTLRLTQLLLEFKHGNAAQLAEFAKTAGVASEEANNFWKAKDYFQLAADCYRASGNTEAQNSLLRLAAESLVKESEQAHTQPGRGAMVAASVLSDAIEAMRQVPDGRERAAELHQRLLALQPEAAAELKAISSSIDITELVQRAREAVRDKSLHDAIYTLCTLASPPSVEKLKHEVHEQARVAVLSSFFSSEILNSRGRVVARAPALETGTDDLKSDGLRWRMFRQASLTRGLTVEGQLNPARAEIVATHNPDRQDLVSLIQYSPWIPKGHEESILRALVAGFQGDMLVVGHLVPPQLEAMVRHIVESNGGATSMLEPGGLQPERPLSVLLETPEALQAFGVDGIFELQDLLIDPLGINLRNEIAHGLRDDSRLFDANVFYAWWLLLRYCVVTSKIVEKKHVESSPSSAMNASSTSEDRDELAPLQSASTTSEA